MKRPLTHCRSLPCFLLVVRLALPRLRQLAQFAGEAVVEAAPVAGEAEGERTQPK